MREIEKYISNLMKEKHIPSYRQLSIQLGMGPNEIQQIMSRGVTPSDELCRKLAEFAGDPIEVVLVIAAESRAPEGTKDTWKKIADIVKKASNYMFALAIVVGGVLLASPAEAAVTSIANAGPSLSSLLVRIAVVVTIHYATWKKRILGLLNLFFIPSFQLKCA